MLHKPAPYRLYPTSPFSGTVPHQHLGRQGKVGRTGWEASKHKREALKTENT